MPIDEIVRTCKQYFQLERALKSAFTDQSAAGYNAVRAQMIAQHGHPDLHLFYSVRSEDWSDEKTAWYARMQRWTQERELCKVSVYQRSGDKEVFCCYGSNFFFSDDDRKYDVALVYELIDEQPKIVAEWSWPYGAEDTTDWEFLHGDEAMTPKKLTSPTQILRLLPPTGEPASMKDYLKDK